MTEATVPMMLKADLEATGTEKYVKNFQIRQFVCVGSKLHIHNLNKNWTLLAIVYYLLLDLYQKKTTTKKAGSLL